MLLLISVVGGYLIGSIPFAYIIVKQKSRVDIRRAGSGNVGGFNAYAVTRSPLVGVAVGLLDGAKGAIAAAIPTLGDGNLWVVGAGVISATLGHVFPVWLRFKGGRGLATACGGMFFIGFTYIILWCMLWVAAKLRYKSITMANILASGLAPPILLLLPADWIGALIVADGSVGEYAALCTVFSLIFLVSHRDCFSEFLVKGQES